MKATKLMTCLFGMMFLSFKINAQVTWNVPTSIASPSSSYFGTTSATDVAIIAGGTTSERMRIVGSGTKAGFVGIGTSSTTLPNSLFDVHGSNPILTISSLQTNNQGAWLYFNNGTVNAWSMGYSVYSNWGSGDLHITGTTSGTKGIHLASGGGVTFGTNSLIRYTGNASADYIFDGTVSIGNITNPNLYSSTNTTGYSLYAVGGILTEKVKVATTGTTNWADFVFDKNYTLKSLKEVETFINQNHHLPEIPSTEEVNKNGVDLLEMDAKLLQKIEELTLYMIEMKKENETLKKSNDILQTRVTNLEKNQ